MFVIIIIVIALIWYINGRSNTTVKKKEQIERSAYFDEKYKRDYDTINYYHSRVSQLDKLFDEMINLKVIKRLIEEDPDKYESIGNKIKSGNKDAGKEIDIWADSSKYKDLPELMEIKNVMNKCRGKYNDLFDLWPKLGSKFLKAKHPLIQETLDDISDATMSVDSFHVKVSEGKYFNKDKTSKILKELIDLENKLSDVLLSCKERYYEGNE